jgi:hypothetical protein
MKTLMIGLEREFLVATVGSPDKFVVVPDGFPADECGLLAEARGQPFTSVEEAVFSLQADTYRLTKQFEAKGLVLVDLPIGKIDKAVRLQAARHYDKGRTKYQNLYGYEAYRNAMTEQTAGIHVSFTCPVTVSYDSTKPTTTVNGMFDWAKIFIGLDKEFAAEIKAAKRNPGFYELKHDGRIEYRSLPNNVNFNKLIETLKKLTK